MVSTQSSRSNYFVMTMLSVYHRPFLLCRCEDLLVLVVVAIVKASFVVVNLLQLNQCSSVSTSSSCSSSSSSNKS